MVAGHRLLDQLVDARTLVQLRLHVRVCAYLRSEVATPCMHGASVAV